MEQSQEQVKSGIKYPGNVVKLGGCIHQQFISKSTKTGSEIEVHVGEVQNPTHFWVILKEGLSDLTNLLMYYIQEVYYDTNQSEELKIPENDVTQGLFCVAMYADEYNRCFVRKVNTEKHEVEVLFVDYGTISRIDSRNLYFLLNKFAYMPQQAIKAKLAGVRSLEKKWSQNATTEFSRLVENREFTAKLIRIDRINKILRIALVDNKSGENIAEALIAKKLALEENETSPELLILNKTETELQKLVDSIKLEDDMPNQLEVSNIKEKEEVMLYVGDVISPSKFWVILNNGYEELQNLAQELEETYSYNEEPQKLKIPITQLKEGMLCISLYGLEYCRAFITKVRMEDGGKVDVFYFDYGTFSSVEANQLYFMYERFALLPQQAVRASLMGIVPLVASKPWSTQAINKFSGMVYGKPLTAKIICMDQERQILKVSLFDCSTGDRKCINNALVQEKCAGISF